MNSKISNESSHVINLKNFINNKYISDLASDCKRFRTFDPITTLYCFLHQALTQCSAKHSLINLNIKRSQLKEKLVSMNTAAYTRAKKRLNESKLFEIACGTGKEIQGRSCNWLWKTS